ncbi:MAG: hypothetical protein H6742_14930 [Alphaproteobacteria bacterium]|nr:hypothetical protein [Alphaproteobacteria bacterium]
MHPVPAALLVALPLAVASLGWRNPVDALARGRFSRNFDAGDGYTAWTLCVPASSPDELPGFQAALPGVLHDLADAGVAAVGMDLPLSADAELRAATLAAAERLHVAWSVEHDPPAVAAHHRVASNGMLRTPVGDLNLGAKLPAGDGPWPLAVELLALHHGGDPPHRRDGALVIGAHRWEDPGHALPFMPYWVGFLDWDDPQSWGEHAAGDTVVIGACRLERELARFGRQPGTVAHSELIETILAGQRPRQAHPWLDLLLTLSTGAAAGALRRFVPRAGLVGPVLVGLLGVGGALLASLTGLFLTLTGPLLAGLCFGLAAARRR